MSAVRKMRTSRPAEIAPRIPCRTRERRNRSSPAGNGRPARRRSSCGRLPERSEREKREDEHDRPAPEEEPIGNGQVAHAADPMGQERQGRTSSSRDRQAPALQLGLEETGSIGLEADRRGLTGSDVGAQVVAVEVHLVRELGLDHEDDLAALLDGEVLHGRRLVPRHRDGDPDDGGLGRRGRRRRGRRHRLRLGRSSRPSSSVPRSSSAWSRRRLRA